MFNFVKFNKKVRKETVEKFTKALKEEKCTNETFIKLKLQTIKICFNCICLY